MTGWDIAKNLSVCIFEVHVLIGFASCVLDRKGNEIRKILSMACGIILLTSINCFNNPDLNLLCVPVTYLGIIVLLFEGTIIRKLSLALSYYVMIILPEFLFAAMISLSGLQDYCLYISSRINELVMLLIMKNMTFIIAKIVGHYYQRKDFKIVHDKIFAMMMVQPIATLCILVSIFYADVQTNGIGKNMLLAGVLLLLFSNIFVFYVFDCLIFNMDKVKKMEVLFTKSHVEQRHFEYLEKVTSQHNELLHDIKRYIRTACELISKEDNKDAVDLFAELGIKIDTIQDSHFSGNKVLNAILNERKETADRKGVRYQVEALSALETGFIKDIDTIAILGNLIDNAIEAAEHVEDGYVEIQLYMGNEGNFMIWEIRNNFAMEPKRNEHGFITSKHNKREHGIGLHTVEKLVLQYDGILQTKIEGNEFIATIVFSIQK